MGSDEWAVDSRQLSVKAIGFLLFTFSFLLSCSNSSPTSFPSPPLPRLEIVPLGLPHGAEAFGALVGDPYTQANSAVSVAFAQTNSAQLLTDLEGGILSAVFLHHLPPNSPHWTSPVAVDGLVIIAHPNNPVRTLSLAQIQAIFSGQIGNWADVGGADASIDIMSREQGSGLRGLLDARVMATQRVSINARVMATNGSMISAVSTNPNAIGYTSFSSLNGDTIALAIDNITPTTEMLATQLYPLSTPLYFVSLVEPIGEPRAFLAWLQSSAGQAIIGQRLGRVGNE